jgi:porphyrinogen peroxidase
VGSNPTRPSNIAYGSVTRPGTIFVGFAAEQRPLAAMVDSIIGMTGGQKDALTRFAHPTMGACYAVPSAERLAAFGRGT